MNPQEQPVRYDDIDKHEFTFEKHAVKVKKVRRMKRVKIKPEDKQ